MPTQRTFLALGFLTASLIACGGDDAPPDPVDTPAQTLAKIASGVDCAAPVGAGTSHSSTISADETWSAADSPHRVTGHIYLRASATLTIEPCAEVRLSPGVSIDSGGAGNASQVIARGTITGNVVHPVRFVADEAGTHWGTLTVFAPGSVDLAVAALIDGASATSFQDDAGALEVRGEDTGVVQPVARVENVLIRGAEGLGASVTLYGAFAADSHDLVIDGSGNAANPYPIRMGTPAVGTLPTGSYAGNERDEILIDTAREIDVSDTFWNRGVPYRVASTVYVRSPDLASEATLTIEAGVTLRMERNSFTTFFIGDNPASYGALIAQGTAAQPITFTSAEDAPAPGDWHGLYFDGSQPGSNVLDHVIVEYAGGESSTTGFGCGPMDNDASILITGFHPDSAFLANSTIRHGGGGAAVVLGWTSDLDGPDFVAGNTFTDVPTCAVARWQNETPPSSPGDDRNDCL